MDSIRIISYKNETFRNRQEAGFLLGQELREFFGKNTVVLGIPRGGVIIAREIAGTLQAQLDIVLSRKLRTLGHEELAMGSVSENGKVFLRETNTRELDLEQLYIKQEIEQQLAEIARRTEIFRKVRPKVDLLGKTVIVTDDGIATGSTMQAALWTARHEHPDRLVAAVPVASEDALRRLAHDTDEMICLHAPAYFGAVGQFYQDFNSVEDAEVLGILREEGKRISL
jgi:putative phosphoribosyl transferase